MNDLARNQLVELIRQYGIDLIYDQVRVKGLLRDLCGESTLEVNVLITALEHGIPEALMSTSDAIPFELTISRLASILTDDCGLKKNLANYAINSWAMALGKSPVVNDSKVEIRGTSTLPNNFIPLIPILLTPTVTITNLDDFPFCCDRAWEQALTLFIEGKLTESILKSVKNLRITNRDEAANKLYEFYLKVKKFESHIKGHDILAQNVALENLIETFDSIDKPILDIQPLEINLKMLEHPNIQSEILIFRNNGRGYLYIEIHPQNQFIHAMPYRFGCFPGDTIKVNVKIDLSGYDIPPEGDIFFNLRVYSNVEEKIIPINICVGRPKLDVHPLDLNIGTITSGQTASSSFFISNSGEVNLNGMITSKPKWLRFTTTNFQCKPGETFKVHLTVDTKGLPSPSKYSDNILLDSNGGKQSITVNMQAVSVDVDKKVLEFHWALDIEKEIVITNSGYDEYKADIYCSEDWVKIAQPRLALREGDRQTIAVAIDFEVLGKFKKQAILSIESKKYGRISILIKGDGLSNPRFSSGLKSGWELISPKQKVVQVSNESDLRKLISEGYILV